MKIRHGFVSNSSSSSFVIGLDRVNATQLMDIEEKIKNTGWDMYIDKNKGTIIFDTMMDNVNFEATVMDVLAGYKCKECRNCPYIEHEEED